MRLFALPLILTATLALTACHTMNDRRAPELTVQKAPLDFTTWELLALNGQPADSARPPTLSLDSKQMRAFGFAGCNRYFAGYKADGQFLSFSQAGSTKMLCPDMATEDAFLKALSATTRYRLDGNVLELWQDQELRLRFRAKVE